MNAMDPIPEPDNQLIRAEKTLRESSVPDGPSNELVARTRAALRAAEECPDQIPVPRRRPMIAMLRFAAAASMASAAAGLTFLATIPRAEATTALAETTKKIQDARTLSYLFSVRIPGQAEPMTGRSFYKDPGLVRTESDTPQASVTVMDSTRGKFLILDPKIKVAILQDWKPSDDLKRRSRDQAADATKQLRSLAGKNGKPVGKRKIGDVQADGYRVDVDGIEWTVWLDADRKFPLLMETTFRVQDRDMPATLSDFRLDPRLEDSLFRLDPPEGYALRKIDVPLAFREEALVNLLRLYADASGGAFPPKPDDTAAFQKRFPKEKWKGPDDPQMIRLAQSMAASVVFLQLELKNSYGYAPENTKLGDAAKVLLWYRPTGSSKYRAIFGDLHAEDVAADRLPEKPKF